MLPFLQAVKGSQTMQLSFRGLNLRDGAEESEFSQMTNMSADRAPMLSPRQPRSLLKAIVKPNGMLGGSVLCWVDSTDFYYDGFCYGQVADSRKQLVRMGAKILIFPDKLSFDTEYHTFASLENDVTVTQVTCAPCTRQPETRA